MVRIPLASLSLGLIVCALPCPVRSQERETHARLDSDGTVYVGSDAGRPIQMAGPGHCAEIKFASDNQTVGCSVTSGGDPAMIYVVKRIEVYLRNGRTNVLESEDRVSYWQFWKGGEQVAICWRLGDKEARYVLYDAGTGRVVEEINSVPEAPSLPQWAKSPAQIDDESVPVGEKFDAERRKWIAKILRQVEQIHPGMTRADLLKTLTTEGGLSTRRRRTYVYPGCQYVKVDVQFRPSGDPEDSLTESPNDIVESVSRPYLAWAVFD